MLIKFNDWPNRAGAEMFPFLKTRFRRLRVHAIVILRRVKAE